MSAAHRSVVIFVRSVARSLPVFRDGVGLRVSSETDSFARLVTKDDFKIDLVQADSEAQTSTAYSPFLTFTTDDMDTKIPHLISHGAVLDGPIQHQLYGKVAALRLRDGLMIGLYERPDNFTEEQAADFAVAEASRKRTSVE